MSKPKATAKRKRGRTLEQQNLDALSRAEKRLGDARVPEMHALISAVRALAPLIMNFCSALMASRECERLFHAIYDGFIYASGEVTTSVDLETGEVKPFEASEADLPKLEDPKYRARMARDIRRLCTLGAKAIHARARTR